MIDKSIRQQYQDGENVNPYRKGLEIIAGKGKAPAKITAKDLIQPARKMTLPPVKTDRAVPPITTLPRIAHPSLDSARYSGLVNILAKTKEGSYLDKYINRDPVRIVERAAEAYPTDVHPQEFDGLISSLVGTDKESATSPDIDNILAQLTTSPKTDTATTFTDTDTATTFTDKGETATSYNDTQIRNIYKDGSPETKNLITNITNKASEILNAIDIDKGKVLTFAGKKAVTNIVGKELGIGSVGGLPGIILTNTVGWVWDKLFGGDKKEETGETPKGAISFDDLVSDDKITTKPTVEDTAAMEDIITAPPVIPVHAPDPYRAPVKAPVTPRHSPHHVGHNGGGGGGGMGKGQDPGGGAAGSPFFKGGRVDTALGGRSRDI